MTVCNKCGLELKKGAKFCKACGSGRQDEKQRQDKKSRVLSAAEKKSGGKYIALAIVAVAIGAGLFFALGNDGPAGAPGSSSQIVFANVKAEQGRVSIPVSSIQGSKASYFVYAAAGKEVKFFALRAPDGTIRVALDACQACYRAKLGYHQEGDTMVCNNCGIAFRSADIGIIRGGCNPIPLDNSTENGVLLVKAKDIEDGATYF